MIASPEICKKPPPPPLPGYPPPPCECTIWSYPAPGAETFELMYSLAYKPAGNHDPVDIWINSFPNLPWTKPYHRTDNSTASIDTQPIPPGTTSITVTAGIVFTDGHRCGAHFVVATPPA